MTRWILACLFALPLASWAQEAPPNTWAVIIGISKFKNLSKDDQLQFADKDAETFAKFIKSPRGRSFPESNIKLLLNEDATLASLKRSLGNWIQRSAKSNDIVYIYIATHSLVEKEASKGAYLVTSDADPEDPYSTAFAMKDLADVVINRSGKAGRVVLFADACRSGKMAAKGALQSVESEAQKNKEVLGLMASRATELSQEGPQFCGGHGAFTCYLLKGLNGEADADKDKSVTFTELLDYMNANLPKATGGQQHVREFGNPNYEAPLAFPDKPGIDLPVGNLIWRHFPQLLASRLPFLTSSPDLRQDFEQAIKSGNLLAPPGKNAWELYQNLERSPAPQREREDARDALAVALEDKGQEILVRYLRGDAQPLTAQQYRYGADLFARATDLTPDQVKLKARSRFCEGRALLLEQRPQEAEVALRDAVRLDRDGPYSYNALGISYLQLGRYREAIDQFQAAVERAPKWAYPHYNLALAYKSSKRLKDAENAYKAAINLGQRYAYLYYSLGLFYLEQKNEKDAEAQFREAIKTDPNRPDAYNMLGTLYERQGKLKEAEENLRTAIRLQPDAALSHNTLAHLLFDRGRFEEAEKEIRSVLQLNPSDALAYVLLGDIHTELKRFAEAANEYTAALALGLESSVQMQVEKKKRQAESKIEKPK
jgi:tetratricopeptide (TPR) repeat protein